MTEPRQVLDGRYRLDEPIAAGGMGEVWRGTDLALSRSVAIKLLHPEHARQPDGLARFRAEAQHAGSLSHPNIAQIYDYCEPAPPDPAYLVMELVDGPSLARYLDHGPLSPAQTLDVIEQAASGLAAAHRSGLLHRDIKPGNLLLSHDGLVKITDFGIARVAGSAAPTRTGALTGTPAYLAPERFSGAAATPATDLYALGVVAHECLTGQVPFAGEPLVVALAHVERDMPPLPPSVPADLAALIADLTRKDPAARPASAIAVLARTGLVRATLPSTAFAPAGPNLAGPMSAATAGLATPAAAGPTFATAVGPPSAAPTPAGSTPVAGSNPVTAAGSNPATAAGSTPGAALLTPRAAGTSSAGIGPTGTSVGGITPAEAAPAASITGTNPIGANLLDLDSPRTNAAGTSASGTGGAAATSAAGPNPTRTSLTGTSAAAGATAAGGAAAGGALPGHTPPGRYSPRWAPRRAALALAGVATAGLAGVVIWMLTGGPSSGTTHPGSPSRAPAAQQASPRHSAAVHPAAARQGHTPQPGSHRGAHTGTGHRRHHGTGTGSTQPTPTVSASTPSTAPTPTQPAATPTVSSPAPTPSASVSANGGVPSTGLALASHAGQ